MASPTLPQEIIYEILSNVPTRQLCTLLTTSKAIYLDVKGILNSRLENHLRENGDHKLLVRSRPSIIHVPSISPSFGLSSSPAGSI
jgi:hypothetical protein